MAIGGPSARLRAAEVRSIQLQVEFRLLGPLELHDVRGPVAVTSAQHRKVLSALLLNVNRGVSVTSLIEAVWADEPPVSARKAIQVFISQLRRLIRDSTPDVEIVFRQGAYWLQADPGSIDLQQFRALVDRADGEPPATAARTLREALTLWRGPALAELENVPRWGHLAHSLEEERLAALEQRIAADVQLDRSSALIAELRSLTTNHPLRERLWLHLIGALAECGRQGEALSAYQQVRRLLRTELGIEPHAELRELQLRVLAGEFTRRGVPTAGEWDSGRLRSSQRRLRTAPRWAPFGLPTPDSGFVGRATETGALRRLLGRPQEMAVGVLTGGPGTGKSALAVRVAHSMRADFPDGQLFTSLGGRGTPRDPHAVLAELLRSLGVPREGIADDPAERSGQFRALLADRSVLLVLDDAADSAQVRPLLPGTAGCSVIVTSRYEMPGLEVRHGARRMPVGPLAPEESVALVSRALGHTVGATLGAASELAERCGHLPLALRVATVRLAVDPWTRLDGVLRRLAGAEALSWLELPGQDELSVRAAFDSAYRNLTGREQRAFRMLTLTSRSGFAVEELAVLLDCSGEEATELLWSLSAAGLVTSSSLHGRSRMNRLLWLYAAERAADEEPAAVLDAARRRLTAHAETAVPDRP